METIDTLIDRIVDGGMMPDELGKAIERLDAAPESWRQCALAFLEAQSWADAFRSMDEPIAEQVPGVRDGTRFMLDTAVSPVPATRAVAPHWRLRSAAMAAGIAWIAFSLGWLSHGVRRTRGEPDQKAAPLLAEALKTSEPQANQPAQVDESSTPLQPGSIAGLPTDRLPTVREVARLRFGTGDEASAEIPIFAGPGITPRWLLEQPPPVSEHDRAIWQRQGYELEQQRRLLSIPLADGRRATVPVDHVQVRYVGQVPL